MAGHLLTIQIDGLTRSIAMNAGFLIIALSDYPDPDTTEVVLGVRPNLHEYVTWIRIHGNEYYHGHYFHKFEDAVKDFKVR